MAVAAHDQRDFDFAKKFDLEIVEVVKGGNIESQAYTGDGEHINSEFLNGLETQKAKESVIKHPAKSNVKRSFLKNCMRKNFRFVNSCLKVVF